jgi:hypothetical protein
VRGIFGKPERRWKDNIKNFPEVTVCEDVNWVHLALDKDEWRVLLNTEIKLRFA